MATPIYRYEEDPSGKSPDNLVANETRTLARLPVRVVAPTYGAYFEDSLQIMDMKNGKLLTRDQYHPSFTAHMPTLKYGQSIYYTFVITDQTVSDNISITYQCLGGSWAYDNSRLIAEIEKLLNTADSVDWKNIINKPDEFYPAPHLHDVGDMYGFEYEVEALYMIRQALLMFNAQQLQQFTQMLNQRDAEFDTRIIDLTKSFNSSIATLTAADTALTQQQQNLYTQLQQYYTDMTAMRTDLSARITANTNLINAIKAITDKLDENYVSIPKTNLGVNKVGYTNTKDFTLDYLLNAAVGHVTGVLVASTERTQPYYVGTMFPPTPDNVNRTITVSKIARLDNNIVGLNPGFLVLAEVAYGGSGTTKRTHRFFYGIYHSLFTAIQWEEFATKADVDDVVRKSTTFLGMNSPTTPDAVSRVIYRDMPTGTVFSLKPENLYTAGNYEANASPAPTEWFYMQKVGIRNSSAGFALVAYNYNNRQGNMMYIGTCNAPASTAIVWRRVMDVAEIDALILGLQNQINNLKAADIAINARIDSLTATVNSYGTRITAVEKKATDNATAIAGLTTRMTAVEKKATDNATAISEHNTRIAALESKMTTAQADIVKLKTDVTNLTTRMTAAEGVNTTQNSRLTSLESRATAIESVNSTQTSDISALKTRATAIESKNTSQDTEISALKTSVTNVETKNTAQDTRLTNLESRATSIESVNISQNTRLTTLENTVGNSTKGLVYDVTNLKTEITNIKSGYGVSPDSGNLLQKRPNGIYYGITAPPNLATLYVDAILGNDSNAGNTADVPLKTFTRAVALGMPGTNRTIRLKESQIHLVYDPFSFRGGGQIYVSNYGPKSALIPSSVGDGPDGQPAMRDLGTTLKFRIGSTSPAGAGATFHWISASAYNLDNGVIVYTRGISIEIDYAKVLEWLAQGPTKYRLSSNSGIFTSVYSASGSVLHENFNLKIHAEGYSGQSAVEKVIRSADAYNAFNSGTLKLIEAYSRQERLFLLSAAKYENIPFTYTPSTVAVGSDEWYNMSKLVKIKITTLGSAYSNLTLRASATIGSDVLSDVIGLIPDSQNKVYLNMSTNLPLPAASGTTTVAQKAYDVRLGSQVNIDISLTYEESGDSNNFRTITAIKPAFFSDAYLEYSTYKAQNAIDYEASYGIKRYQRVTYLIGRYRPLQVQSSDGTWRTISVV